MICIRTCPIGTYDCLIRILGANREFELNGRGGRGGLLGLVIGGKQKRSKILNVLIAHPFQLKFNVLLLDIFLRFDPLRKYRGRRSFFPCECKCRFFLLFPICKNKKFAVI